MLDVIEALLSVTMLYFVYQFIVNRGIPAFIYFESDEQNKIGTLTVRKWFGKELVSLKVTSDTVEVIKIFGNDLRLGEAKDHE